MSAPSTPLENILRRATELGPRDSLAYLKEACAGDNNLFEAARQRLAALRPRNWCDLDSDHEDFADEPLTGSRQPGELIGPYRIVRVLGRGGMGEVYLCERADDQYRQRVAIKLVHAGLVSKQIHNRLRTERQILASLDHPNIARLLDGGATADGVPYLVLEYIDGEPIDKYCDRRRLTIEQRLELFRTVCSAVQAAHRSLIVHRDLKPNNILVTADGTPKLLDFGIAKPLDNRHTSHTQALTHADIRVMTPDHASPEQVRGGLITTASDIYVLGVLLYELLSGRRPFETVGLRLTEVERLICEKHPVPPSQAPRESDVYTLEIAANRSTTAPKLRRALEGDLDTIVMMAMRKEPERRYSTVEQFSGDIERFMTGMPVIACRDTWSYRTGKFLKRHTFAAIAVSGVALLLAGSAVSMYVQAQRVKHERDVATAEKARAEIERSRAERVSEFLVDIFQRSDPSEARGADITAREILERGAKRVDTELQKEPHTQATLMDAMGRVYLGLGLPNRALPLLQRSLTLREQVYGTNDPMTAAGMRSLAAARLDKGELPEAERLLREALKIQSLAKTHNTEDIAATLHSLAAVLLTRGDLEAASDMYSRTISILSALHGERRQEVTSVKNELAYVMLIRGNYAEAEKLYASALATDRELLGSTHPQVLHQISGLASALQMQQKLSEAEPLFQESIAIAKRVLGPEHPDTIRATSNYGWFLQVKGDLDGAERVAREVLALDEKVRGPNHYYVGFDMANLAHVLYDRGQLEETEALYRKALDIYKQTLPQNHQYIATALTGLARVFAERGDTFRVNALIDRAVNIWRKELAEDRWQLANTRAVLGRCASKGGKFADAEQTLLASYAALEKQRGLADPDTARTRRWLADLYTAWNKPELVKNYR